MITTEMLIAKVEEIAAEDPSYRIGGTGTDGTCDCIGLIVGAIRRAGGQWTGTKGTNYATRHEMVSLRPIAGNADLAVGEVVYKAREPGEPGYDEETVRKRYADSPDQRDYYHIGIVESVRPLRIRHMTTPRARMDTELGKWKYHGELKKVRISSDGPAVETDPHPEGGETAMETAVIYGGNIGLPVNLRSSGFMQSPILCTIPQRTRVELLEYGERWCRVDYRGRKGAVQTVFVHREAEDIPDAGSYAGDPAAASPEGAAEGIVQIRRGKLEAVYDEIGDWLGLRG